MRTLAGRLAARIDRANPAILAIALVLIFLAVPILSQEHLRASGDLSVYLNSVRRAADGELPYRDFWLLYSPGHVWLGALASLVCGSNVNGVLLFSILISALAGGLGFGLGKLLCGRNRSGMVLASLIFFTGEPGIYSSHGYPHACSVFLLLAAIFLVRYLRGAAPTDLVAAGASVGAAMCFRMYEAGAALCAAMLAVLALPYGAGRFGKRAVLRLIALGAGPALAAGFMLAYFASAGMLPTFVRELTVESVSHSRSVHRDVLDDWKAEIGGILGIKTGAFGRTGHGVVPAGLLHPGTGPDRPRGAKPRLLERSRERFGQIARAAVEIVLYLVPLCAVPLAITYFARSRDSREHRATVLFFAAWGLFTASKVPAAPGLGHLAYSHAPFFCVMLLVAKSGVAGVAARAAKLMIVCLLLWSLLCCVRAAKSPWAETFEVQAPLGRMRFVFQEEARASQAVLDLIDTRARKGDYVFVIPVYAPPWNALTAHRNPTYYDSILDLAVRNTAGKQNRVCSDLLTKNTPLIVHYAKPEAFRRACPIVQECIERNYELVQETPPYAVYARKRASPAPDRLAP